SLRRRANSIVDPSLRRRANSIVDPSLRRRADAVPVGGATGVRYDDDFLFVVPPSGGISVSIGGKFRLKAGLQTLESSPRGQ
ncbi:MAG TPA: hypothetical protein PK992_12150, partial [Planctomycetaceae bacterium]|nr:hypothetical protein [Planctomycetaceae bacterium]